MYLLGSLAKLINMWIPQVLFFLPETKEKTLEELDAVFNVPLRVHAKYGRKWLQKQPYALDLWLPLTLQPLCRSVEVATW